MVSAVARIDQKALIGLVVGGVALVLFLAACMAVVIVSRQKRIPTGSPDDTTNSLPPGGVVEVKGTEVWDDFSKNLIWADKKWIGRRIRLTAIVMDIGRDRHGFYLLFHPPLEVRPAHNAEFANVSLHTSITIETTLTGYSPAQHGSHLLLKGSDARRR